MITVGLTGGIGCGKSTVARLFADRGAAVLDLDQVARQVVAPGEPALAEIAARWPEAILDGALDRKALGAIILADVDARRALEAITHPRIWEQTEAWLAAQTAPVAMIEAALMVETGSWRRYDKLVVVSCSPETQRRRLMARNGLDEATAARWVASQMPVEEKERVADYVIRNEGGEEALHAAVASVWQSLVNRDTP